MLQIVRSNNNRGESPMSIAINARKVLFLRVLLAITGSVLFDPFFATDPLPSQTVPEPNILPLLRSAEFSGLPLP